MHITYFHWAKGSPPSIGRSFSPLIKELSKTEDVKEFYVPHNGSLPWNMLKNIWFVYKNRDKNGVNHITGDIHYCILGLIGCKSILTIHDDYAISHAKRGIFDKLYKYIFWIYLPVKLASRTICISSATKDKILARIESDNISVISNHSVNTEFTYLPKSFNNDCPIILQIGANPHKNLDTTIKAIALIGQKSKLRVIKEMSQEQHNLCNKLNIDYSNSFDLSDKQIVEEYINADIVTFPSLYEGFGMPIIEAQATGRVIITSNLAPMNEVAGSDGAILLDNPLDADAYAEALKLVIKNREIRESKIKNGLRNVARYKVDVPAKKYLELYNMLLNSNKYE